MDSRDWFLAYISLVDIGFPSRVVSRWEGLGENVIRSPGGESYAQPAYECMLCDIFNARTLLLKVAKSPLHFRVTEVWSTSAD